MGNVLANSINTVPHLTAFDEMAAQQLGNIDISPLMMYIIDTAPEEALPYLAAQFHVLGYEGMFLADTPAKRRVLIKKAIELHKYKGTPWSIKEALKVIGIYDAIIEEGLTVYYDGGSYFDGSITYGGGNWAIFRVKIDINGLTTIDAAYLNQIKALINEYKNVRSWLVDVSLLVSVNEAVSTSDSFEEEGGYNESLARGLLYNGGGFFDGGETYRKGNDQFVMTIHHTGGESEL